MLRRSSTRASAVAVLDRATVEAVLDRPRGSALPVDHLPAHRLPADALEWSWPPYAPVQSDLEPFDTEEWAPASVVWHPQLRVGRWTVLYRRLDG